MNETRSNKFGDKKHNGHAVLSEFKCQIGFLVSPSFTKAVWSFEYAKILFKQFEDMFKQFEDM